MAVRLTNLNTRKTLDYSEDHWQKLLAIAEQNGWHPQNTIVPKFADFPLKDWDGSYFPANGQQMIAPDAQDMANALLKALSNSDYLERPSVEEFAKFCKLGSFLIENA